MDIDELLHLREAEAKLSKAVAQGEAKRFEALNRSGGRTPLEKERKQHASK